MVLVLCSIMTMVTVGCGQEEMPSPNELNESIVTQESDIENDTSAGKDKEQTNEENKNTYNETMGNSDKQISKDTPIVAVKKPSYAISEKTETYIDRFGMPAIKKEYVVPFHADIQEIAPTTITTNNIQYGIESITSPQNFEEKKVTKEIVAKTKEEAKKFVKEYEYSDTDGTGTLTLDPNSVEVNVNNSQQIPSKQSVVKTYEMSIKDQNKIPQTITENGITMYLVDVSWQDIGDPGTGINATDEKGAYGTYNTVASSWKASATYSGTKYHTKQDYKGTATYVGKILVQNSATQIYVVTYKPNSMVTNASGLYHNSYVNYMYQNENNKIASLQPDNSMSMYYTNSWLTKLLVAFVILSFVFVGLLMYVAFKVWKRTNDDNIVSPIKTDDNENIEKAQDVDCSDTTV